MCAVVAPYLKQCGPPAFSAMLPPTVQEDWLDGSGAKKSPLEATPFDIQVDNTRLDTSGAILDVDVENLVEPIHRDDDAAFDRNSTPGETRSRASAHERDPRRGTDPDHLRHLFRRAREYHRFGRALESGRPVTFVDQDVLGPH